MAARRGRKGSGSRRHPRPHTLFTRTPWSRPGKGVVGCGEPSKTRRFESPHTPLPSSSTSGSPEGGCVAARGLGCKGRQGRRRVRRAGGAVTLGAAGLRWALVAAAAVGWAGVTRAAVESTKHPRAAQHPRSKASKGVGWVARGLNI